MESTGEVPPSIPPIAREYTQAGLPWFDYCAANQKAIVGSEKPAEMKSVLKKPRAQGGNPLPENASVEGEQVVDLGEGRL